MPDGEQPYQTYDQRAQAAAKEAGYNPNDPGFMSAIRNIAATAQGHMAATAQSRREAAQLAREAKFREGAPTSNADYQGFEHKQLKSFVTDDMDPGQVGAMSQPWTDLANAMAQFADDLNVAVNQSKAVWQGDAAEQAHGFSSNMSTWSEETGEGAQLVSERMHAQSSSASTAKNSMPEPIEFSWGDEIKGWLTSPAPLAFTVADSFEKQQRSQEAHDEAVRVLNSYDSSLADSAAKTPAFSKPPTLAGDSGGVDRSGNEIGGREAGTPGVGGTGGVGGSTGTAGYTPGTSGTPSVNGPGSGGTGSSAGAGAGAGAGGAAGSTAASGYNPGDAYGPRGRGSGGFGPGSGGGAGGMGAVPFGPMGGAGGFGPGGSGGAGSGGGGFGPRGSGAMGPGAGAGGGAGAGKMAGAGPMGGAAGAGAGAKGGAGGGGRGGMGGMMGGAGAGKGQGGDDSEHRDQYFVKQEFEVGLTETDEHGEKMIDPETGLPVVPPVIGG